MNSTPKKVSAGASRPSESAVIVRHEFGDESIPLSRLGPAGLLSVCCHAFLMTAFVFLAPTGYADGPLETKIENVIDAVPEDEPFRPEFTGTEVQTTPGKSSADPTNPSSRLDDITIPGLEDMKEKVGLLIDGPDRPPTSILAPAGPGNGLGIPKSGEVGAAIDGTGPPGGGVWTAQMLQNPFKGRSSATKSYLLEHSFGSEASEAAVAKGLKWLVRVQSANGAWKLDGDFPDKGTANDVGGTALGLLPFLGAGFTQKAAKTNPYDKTIERGLRFLIASQDKRTGSFSRDMYAHGLAAIAMSEAFALSQDYTLKKPAQAAMNFIVSAQHAGGGWRYQPGQAGDTSVSGWQIMALKSGLMAGLDIPNASLRRAQVFLDSVADTATEGSGYTDPNPTPTMTAVSLLCRQYLSGWGRQNLRLIKAVDNHIKPNPPRPDKKDVYFYYYATQVMHNLGGDDWKNWNAKMRDQLIASQANDVRQQAVYGSWSPAGDQWGASGGRLMVTSLNLLTLEVYYRYLPLYYREKGN